jgi:glycosyltransferase involved in cell wall biosynthesis
MSAYNAEQYLTRSIESILHQTFADFEFLIIDDGSQDRSKEIIEAFRDPRIRLISRENKGLTASLNEGIQEAKGEYIARQDADDASLPERLEREVAFLDSRPEVGMVGTNYIIIDEEGKRLDQSRVFTHPDDLALAELLSNQFGHGSVMMRRSVLDQAGPYDPKVGIVEDYDLFCRISRVSKLANLKEPLYRWRRTGGGVTLSNQKLQIKQAFAVRDREFQEHILKDRQRYRILTSIHPRSVPPGPMYYFDKKSTVLRDLAWLYRAEGRRRESVRMMAAALLFAPWRRRNWRYLLRSLVESSTKPLWEYESI